MVAFPAAPPEHLGKVRRDGPQAPLADKAPERQRHPQRQDLEVKPRNGLVARHSSPERFREAGHGTASSPVVELPWG